MDDKLAIKLLKMANPKESQAENGSESLAFPARMNFNLIAAKPTPNLVTLKGSSLPATSIIKNSAIVNVVPYKPTNLSTVSLASIYALNFRDNIQVIEPVTILGDPISVGNYLVWPDQTSRQLYFVHKTPQLKDFSLTVNRSSVRNEAGQETITDTSGLAIMALNLYKDNALEELNALSQRAGSPLASYLNWRFKPISIKSIVANVEAYDRNDISSITQSISSDTGMASFTIHLTKLGAQKWKECLLAGNARFLAGAVKFKVRFYAKIRDKQEIQDIEIGGSLSELLSTVGPDAVKTINPEVVIKTIIQITGHQLISDSTVEVKPSRGHQPVSLFFNGGGGRMEAVFTESNPEDIKIDLLYKVNFANPDWPIIERKRTLSYRGGDWTDIIDPASWLDKYFVAVQFFDANGIALAPNSVGVDERVICTFEYFADYLEGRSIKSVQQVHSQNFFEINFPLPINAQAGRLRLTVFNMRINNGQAPVSPMEVREFSTGVSAISINSHADGRVEIRSNTDAAVESGSEEVVFQLMDQLKARSESSLEIVGESGAMPSAETNPAFQQLLRYLRTDEARFSLVEDRYFAALEQCLINHGIINGSFLIDRDNFNNAVAAFQSRNGMTADGIPGEDTLWALQSPDAVRINRPIQVVDADRVAGYQDGYDRFRLRDDVAFYYEGLLDEIHSLGGVITSSGSLRDLDAQVTQGRSSTSMHYSGIALDLYVGSGMRDPNVDPFIVVESGSRWIVYCRVPSGGQVMTLNAAYHQGGRLRTRSVSARVINFTAIAARYGFANISRRACFPSDYMCAEWWHFQNEYVLIPYFSQFGAELLKLDGVNESRLRNAGMWENRKNIFKRDWF